MPYAADSYYTSLDQVEARFAEEIAAVPELGLGKTALENRAAYFARRVWIYQKGHVSAKSTVFAIKSRIQSISSMLSDPRFTNRDLFDLIDKRPDSFLSSKVQRISNNISAMVSLIMDLKDPLLPIVERHQIKNPHNAFSYLMQTNGWVLILHSPKTIGAFRRYALLVKNGKLPHERYANNNGSHRVAILNMPVAELKKRLGDYDARVARAAKARDSVIITPAPTAISMKAGRKSLAQKLQAMRGKAKQEPAT